MANLMDRRVVARWRGFNGELVASHLAYPFTDAGEQKYQLAFTARCYRHDATKWGQWR